MKHPVSVVWIKEARKTGPPPIEFEYKATISLKGSLWSCRLSNRSQFSDSVEYGEIDFLMEEAEKLYLGECEGRFLKITEGPYVVALVGVRNS